MTSEVDGASVAGGVVVAGDDGGTVATTLGRLTVDSTVVWVDEVVVGVVLVVACLRPAATATATVPMTRTATSAVTAARAHRGQPRNAQDPGGTMGGMGRVGSSIGMGCVGLSSS
jgi:hypothetical protein